MSYVVANIDKFTQTSVKAIEKHVERTSDNFKNTDIDKSKTHLNYSLKDCDNYNKKINEILDEKMTSGRKICTTGKNASVVMCGCVISSDTDFFNTLNEKQQREYFEKSLEYMKSKVDNIFKAEVHLDEKTPHLHLYFVPLTPDGRLSGKEVISRKFLKDLQNELPKHLKNSGFKIERGAENSTRKHTDTSKYKRELNVKINEIEKVEKIENNITKIPFSEKIAVNKNDFKEICEIAKSQYKYTDFIDKIHKLDVENKKIKKENVDLKINIYEVVQKNNMYENENKEQLKNHNMLKLIKNNSPSFFSEVEKKCEEITKNEANRIQAEQLQAQKQALYARLRLDQAERDRITSLENERVKKQQEKAQKEQIKLQELEKERILKEQERQKNEQTKIIKEQLQVKTNLDIRFKLAVERVNNPKLYTRYVRSIEIFKDLKLLNYTDDNIVKFCNVSLSKETARNVCEHSPSTKKLNVEFQKNKNIKAPVRDTGAGGSQGDKKHSAGVNNSAQLSVQDCTENEGICGTRREEHSDGTRKFRR